MSSSTHTVFRLAHRNGFDGLQPFTEPTPIPGPSEVLIKVRAVSLNYRDILIARSEHPFPMEDNIVPCSDMAGEVVQVGELVDGVGVGDKVILPLSLELLYGHVKDMKSTLGGPKDGVLREYIVVPGHVVVKIPKDAGQNWELWASLITTGSTVWNAFYGAKPLLPGMSVLVQGTGGVSLTALIFAKAAGATTIVTSSSDEKLAHVREKYGAEHTINYKTTPKWAAEVQRITKGEGVDHVIDIGGVGTIQQSFESICMGGTVSAVGYLKDVPQDQLPNVYVHALMKGGTLRGILGGSKQQLEEVVRFVASRELTMPVHETFGFSRDEVVKAFELVASGKHIGKVCIRVD